ncbi:hypothetical protein [uncultured Anaerotruncus sp.]|uniref:hypothetical protein n=1 Tax=Anaerotruncus massiliensis (ex Liu et al. 2021) TaxID=2321404 RepID=UPI002673A03D|nr:hypothetical protein [uncultured Anaerotruncus sp.]
MVQAIVIARRNAHHLFISASVSPLPERYHKSRLLCGRIQAAASDQMWIADCARWQIVIK